MAMKDEYISKINEALTADDAREMGELVKETVSVFASADPHIKAGLDRYRSRAVVPGQKIIYDNKGDLAKLRGKLVSLREAELKELEADPVRLAFGASMMTSLSAAAFSSAVKRLRPGLSSTVWCRSTRGISRRLP